MGRFGDWSVNWSLCSRACLGGFACAWGAHGRLARRAETFFPYPYWPPPSGCHAQIRLAPYARETVFRAERLSPVTRSAWELRLQEPADTWAIHQLYAASVPRQVQEVEALTSHFWHMDRSRKVIRGVRQTGWILEDEGEPTAYGRYTRGSRAGMIDAVVAPGQGTRLGALLDGVIAVPGGERPRPVYSVLREYLLDMKGELTVRGFAEIGEQELLIRYTTATARTVALDPVHFPVELRQAIPGRVPTFLEGQPTDGTI